MFQQGYLIYGFGKEEADLIAEFMRVLADKPLPGISATGMEKKKVQEILESAPYENFEPGETKLLMFIGMPDDRIGAAMKYFPQPLGRPIFCSPTEQNLQWTFEYLVEHLLEERAAMARKP